jgi:ABC-type phosphate/phosphonate transport system substrate-binding protein
MYDLPWLHTANDDLWRVVAACLTANGIDDVPKCLTRNVDLHALWRSPDLLLAQTCGYPLMCELEGHAVLLATPHYIAEGCEGPYHRSAILVRADDPAVDIADLKGRRAGINDRRSNSGMNLLRDAVAPHADGATFFASVQVTGSHADSFTALLTGAIDVAAIDCVTLAHLRSRYPQQAAQLRILAWTRAVPGLPLILSMAHAHHREQLLMALRHASVDPIGQASLHALRIQGFLALSWEDYAIIRMIEQRAIDSGYPVLQ